ncbi:MAG TPA: tyrosine-type recombinase/integrase [Streptosporangiaceae bacterium]|nr:tyrosine-type recombinase/integrase [Streptosporangiaceae bacterium]
MTSAADVALTAGIRLGPVGRARAGLRALEALDRLGEGGSEPAAADLEELRGWAGWGPMAAAFAPNRSGAWKEIGERLEWLLPPEQLREAQQATPNAFYTPPGTAAGCWQILRHLGFAGGAILEPGCGAGAFMSATPAGVPVAWTGVERDPVTARIAALLHPGAAILNERMQNAALPAHSMDAVLGNVPFGETAVYDPTAPKPVTRSLHNYCIWRSVRALKPGGVAVLITSRYTLDARDQAARLAIADEADLIGAIRLPGKALSPGGTEVVADILVLRRRDGQGEPADQAWIETSQLSDIRPELPWMYDERISQWFVTNPRMVLGELHPERAAGYGRTVRVDWPAEAPPIEQALAETARRLAARARAGGLIWNPPPTQIPAAGDLGVPQRADGRKEQSFHLADGTVVQVRDGLLIPAGKQGKELAELTALIRLRDAAAGLLDAEADYERSEESLAPLRARLNTAYDQYVAAYGPLNRATITTGDADPETGLATFSRRRPRMGGFRQDPDYATVLALENYDDETGLAAKAAIFSRRVNQRPDRPERAGTPAEAIRICLDARGCLDLTVIGRLLDIPPDEVPDRLGGLAYLDPASGDWVTTEEYLSGDVRTKLAEARAAAGKARGAEAGGGSPDWQANIAALEEVQPGDLGPDEIRAKLGAPWIPPDDIRVFAAETLGYPPAVTYLTVIAQWEVKIGRGLADTAAATEEWGTGRIDGYRLLELALNGKAPVVYDTVTTPDGGETRVRNQAETMLAEEKQRALAARFGEWAWEDPRRCDRLCAEYNRRFNSVVLRRYDGSHLTFPGLASGFAPYPHQLDMVHRIISTPASLCPYPVGTGKTPTMFLTARKLKELGQAAKPLIIVPNHLLEQTAREGKRLFPAARILMAAREDLASAQARKLFAARCATGDWDAVVMTHSAFTAIPVHPATQAAHLTDLAAKYRQALTADPGGGRRTVKQLAMMVDAFETRARTLLAHRTDDGVWFEHLGCDFAMVDEAHYFKNLGLPVRTDGFSVAASKRATDLDMKLTLLRERGSKVAALFTGTPVSNSLLEMYVLQHYLHPQRLGQVGLHSADAWAATFVEFATAVEVTPDGTGFRLKRRPSKFENVPELLTLFGEVADLREPGSFAVQRPGARHHAVVISPSAELRAYAAGLAERADKVRQVDSHTDNMLKICSDGRKAALDLELVGITAQRAGKVGAVIANVARIYHDTRELTLPGDDPAAPRGGFQIVFCDLGTPGANGSQVYGKIRAGLIAAGVPASGIRFIHDASTDLAKAALFADCRAGKVAVLLGSTDKLGVGTNIQTRCVALHHVDAPWRPADVEQREGRALRPGNLNPVVDLYRYVSEKSFDSFMWLLNRANSAGEPARSAARRCQDQCVPPSAPLAAGFVRLRTGEMVAGSDAACGSGSGEAGVRDMGSLRVPLAGSVAGSGAAVPYRLIFPRDVRAAAAANAYLADLSDTFARPLTLRSYGYDILRWLRFLAAAGVLFDEASRGDYSDFMRWLQATGKTGGARRPRAGPAGRRLNRETGKVAPDDREFGPATLAHSRIVLHEFYEFLLDRGQRPLVNPVPHAQRRDHGQLRQYPHHNPLADFGRTGRSRKRYDPPDPKGVPRHLPDRHYDRVWAELTCDRDRALVKIATDCGARPAELLGMSGEDIDWGDALIRVLRKGGAHVQWLPVSRDAIVWLRRYQASSGYVAGPGEPVWVAGRGQRRRMSYEAYRAVFTRVNRRLGTNWTPHDLRHTACVRMLDAGMALHQVQYVMGHRHLATTQQYLCPRMDELIEAHREALARPRPWPSGPGPYAQQDLEDLLGPGLL